MHFPFFKKKSRQSQASRAVANQNMVIRPNEEPVQWNRVSLWREVTSFTGGGYPIEYIPYDDCIGKKVLPPYFDPDVHYLFIFSFLRPGIDGEGNMGGFFGENGRKAGRILGVQRDQVYEFPIGTRLLCCINRNYGSLTNDVMLKLDDLDDRGVISILGRLRCEKSEDGTLTITGFERSDRNR